MQMMARIYVQTLEVKGINGDVTPCVTFSLWPDTIYGDLKCLLKCSLWPRGLNACFFFIFFKHLHNIWASACCMLYDHQTGLILMSIFVQCRCCILTSKTPRRLKFMQECSMTKENVKGLITKSFNFQSETSSSSSDFKAGYELINFLIGIFTNNSFWLHCHKRASSACFQRPAVGSLVPSYLRQILHISRWRSV